MAQPLNQQKEPSILQFWDSDKTLIKEVSKSEEVGTTFGYSTKKKRDQDSGKCLWSPAKEEIASSTETKVPAKVPKNRPYLRVSLIPMAIASLFEKSPVLLNPYIPRSNQAKNSKIRYSNSGFFFSSQYLD